MRLRNYNLYKWLLREVFLFHNKSPRHGKICNECELINEKTICFDSSSGNSCRLQRIGRP